MKTAIIILSFITSVSFVLGIYLILSEKKRQILSRLGNYTANYIQADLHDYEKRIRKITFKDILKILGKLFETHTYTKKIEKQLMMAEIPLRGEEFLVLDVMAVIVSGLIGFFLSNELIIAFFLSFLSFAIPFLFIKIKKQKRFNVLNSQISDCITVIANSLRAGYSFLQSIDLVNKEMTGPLAMEFRKTLREINLGTTTDEALVNLSTRVESDDLELMITAVLIQRQIGGNLAEILDNISNTIRERIKIKGEIKTLTAQGRISGLIIGLMPPVLFIILMLVNPSYMSILLEKRAGWIIMGVGLASEIIGALFIKKIVNIEV